MSKATLAVLNVGCGDIRLSFDPKDPAEVIRAVRIVTDMLRRGFALLVEVDDGKGGKIFTRAKRFDEETSCYIIADFDPLQSSDTDEADHAQAEAQAEEPPTGPVVSPAPTKRGRPRKVIERAVPARDTRAVAVSRSAGG